MIRKNHSSLTAALAAGMLMLGSTSSWASDAPQPAPQALPAMSVPAPATLNPPAPVHLAWDRVGIAAFGVGA